MIMFNGFKHAVQFEIVWEDSTKYLIFLDPFLRNYDNSAKGCSFLITLIYFSELGRRIGTV